MNVDVSDRARARDEAARIVEQESGRILSVLDALHADPELSGEEVRSARRLMDELGAEGFEITSGVGGLPTAFTARRGASRSADPARPAVRVGFLAEYDALPGIGHGCGHNLIAAAALGAGIAVGRLVDRLGGEVRVYGTPAEETIGGKVVLARRGAFDGLDAAMMVHPGSEHRVFTNSLACRSVQVEFHGRAAHAVAHPDKGINSLDAMIQLFIAVDHIRRSSRRDVRIPGVILEGGVRPNVVPEKAVAQFSVRASDAVQRDEVLGRLRRTVEAIALATGCAPVFRFTDNPYDEMETNRTLARIYKDRLADEGIVTNDEPREHMGSLDMGNVSYRVPSLHAYVAIVPPEVASHTEAFALATVTEKGRAATMLSARTLARAAVDLLCDAALVAAVREEFAAMRSRAEAARGSGFDAPAELILERP